MDRKRPEYKIEIEPGAITGFYVRAEGHIVACFSSAPELAQWIEQQYGPLDLAPEAVRMPAMLQSDTDSPPGKRGVVAHLLRGGRS